MTTSTIRLVGGNIVHWFNFEQAPQDRKHDQVDPRQQPKDGREADIVCQAGRQTLADGRDFGKKQQLERVRWETDQPVVPNYISVKEAQFFAWSMPIGTLITGAENKELLLEKVELAKQFTALSEVDRENLLAKVLEAPNRDKVEYYKKV